MLNKKFTATFLVCLFIMLHFAPCAFAVNDSYKNNEKLYDEQEYGEVVAAIENYGDNQTANTATQAVGESVDLAYKLYDLAEPDFVSLIQNGKTVADCLSSDYVWVAERDSKLYILINENDEWEAAGYQYIENEHSLDGSVDPSVLENNSGIMSLQNSSQDFDLLFFRAPMYFSEFIYYKAEGTEYLIPFSSRPDLTKLENGKSYTAQDAADILSASFNVGAAGYPVYENGGAGAYASGISSEPVSGENARKSEQNTCAMIIMIAAVMILITVAAVIIIAKKRKNENPKKNDKNV